MNYDEWKQVVNGQDTYTDLARRLLNTGSVIVGWTDQIATHHDILFTYKPSQAGDLQGGLSGPMLYVSVMRIGAFAFRSGQVLHHDYVAEKLGLLSTEAMTELINGVLKELVVLVDKFMEEV